MQTLGFLVLFIAGAMTAAKGATTFFGRSWRAIMLQWLVIYISYLFWSRVLAGR